MFIPPPLITFQVSCVTCQVSHVRCQVSDVRCHLYFSFWSIIYKATTQKLLYPISVIQRKALRLVARAQYNSHTDVLFKTYNFLKFDDLVHLNLCIFMRQYSKKQLPISFKNMFQYLPLFQQVHRDHDYNCMPKVINHCQLQFFLALQMVRTWNFSNVFVKYEAKVSIRKNHLHPSVYQNMRNIV